MNRLTTAFSSAIPSASGDSQGSVSVSTSPVDGSFDRPRSPYGYNERSASAHLSLPPQIYDDPRATHFGAAPDRLFIPSRFGDRRDSSGSRPRRPELLRHVSDGAGGRSGGATPRPRGQSGSRDRERDRGVRANLGQGKRKERIGAMCKGPEDRYAVGGPQYLKILHVARPSSGGTTTPSVQPQTGRAGSPRGRNQAQPLARGPGGASITEVANLWKGSWAVSKGVNDIDWGSGSYDRKIATATPSGNFMLFDLVKNKLERDVSGGHPRPMNCIRLCQTPSYGHLLLTGSTEGVAKLWDMREGEPTSKKYYKHSAAVTSLAFSSVDPHHFAVGTENGVIKRYDMRMAPRPTGSVWGAHGNKPVMDLKWRAGWEGESLDGGGTGGWMASAGADRTVQVSHYLTALT
ncbi:WD40-repeat-containing domain protein [Dioszegia hungarica]|uniref:WD40-repeat-containing domain protein n=1 Tax=Dioszegia hungarica TaxID=4972 RepID=A0AA38HF66_9TREE|nr:WD40-repeat-containing domain protein [Dioszegia hungarica]KAI9638827.1 WD40-repeat-containing domain protein [Dioszegia hungarica]